MLIGSIRPHETRTVEISGDSLEDITAQLDGLAPTGFDLVSAPARMPKGAQGIETKATFARRDEPTEIEAEDMDVLTAKVPEGWQLLSVRAL
jgi:hypothetical protein